ncbi:hypothetical protein K469DRAFT_306422 [Zopfia rhizophila CBS 207.26]|uniref:Uncharacterized protein n=1 Tax=Zopfia rhizophila CBS 207.26 TaxID=1314779 RepID=A0A6A6EN10_9PEZI|nr:hypothetical protein K469DRAFT_306422 [Zopfia rhizophila CBS 207.26]
MLNTFLRPPQALPANGFEDFNVFISLLIVVMIGSSVCRKDTWKAVGGKRSHRANQLVVLTLKMAIAWVIICIWRNCLRRSFWT